MSGWTIYTREAPMLRDIEVLIEHEDRNGKIGVVTSLTVRTLDPSIVTPGEAWGALQRPGGGGGRNFLQAALDAAWQAGLRPSRGLEEVGELKATRSHLEDMRRLVFEQPQRAEMDPRFDLSRGIG